MGMSWRAGRRALGLLLGLALLAACGRGRPAATSTPALSGVSQRASTPSPTATATLSPTPFPMPTATPLAPATPSPVPTPASTPTSAPSPSPSPSPSPISPPLGRIVTEARLRAGPGTHYPVIGVIPPGQEAALMAQDPTGAWFQVDVGDEEQTWIAARLVQPPPGLSLPIAANIPTPPPSPTPGDVVQLYESEIRIPTYPWQAFLTPALDETTGWTYQRFDRNAYQNANPQPSLQTYQLINLENRWLRVNVMPELGGRVYQFIFKSTGSDAFYQNPVIKPSPWGPEEAGAGWLAAGGMEWGLPVPEHGYAWGEPWGYITLPGDGAQSVTLFDDHQESAHLSVTLTLSPDSSALQLHFELENLSPRAVPVSFWLNAMLAPGPANSVGPELRFLFPMSQASVHATGDPALPPPGRVFHWPMHQGRDMSRLGNWTRWLGFFAHPQAQASWAAVVDMASDEGVVRVFPHHKMPGLKGFGFGWSQPISPENYTDDGSAYVEMQGGVTPTYEGRLTLQPGESYVWDETWYPVAGLRGVSQADATGAANIIQEGDGPHLRLMSVRPITGQLVITDAAGQTLTQEVSLAPNAPADMSLTGMQLPIAFHLQAPEGDWGMSDLR